MTELSVVIPTRMRPTTLVGTLTALARQDVPLDTFEVIVVADGEDDSLTEVRARGWPFRVSLLSKSRGGAASARNFGARRAQAPVLLFLDDDMAAAPGVVSAHLACHANSSADVVLGHFTQATTGLSDPFFATYVRAWWSRRFSDMAQSAHRFRYDDLFSGHFSIKRSLFDRVGGFDERFTHAHAGEDYELAARLLASGARFVYAPVATAVHEDDPTVERVLRRAFADGRGHAIMAREHPEMLMQLPLGKALHHPELARKGRSKWAPRAMASLAIFKALKMRRMWGQLFGLAYRRAYWSGVLIELGSPAALRRLLQEPELAPRHEADAVFDVRDGYAGLVGLLASRRVGSLDVWVGETPICRIPRLSAAEPLRPEHVVDWLALHHAWAIVQALGALNWTLDSDSCPRALNAESLTGERTEVRV